MTELVSVINARGLYLPNWIKLLYLYIPKEMSRESKNQAFKKTVS